MHNPDQLCGVYARESATVIGAFLMCLFVRVETNYGRASLRCHGDTRNGVIPTAANVTDHSMRNLWWTE